MGCIGPISYRPTAFGSKNIGDGIYAPNAPRFCLCGLDELFTAVRPRNDLDGIGVRQSYHDPGVAWRGDKPHPAYWSGHSAGPSLSWLDAGASGPIPDQRTTPLRISSHSSALHHIGRWHGQ